MNPFLYLTLLFLGLLLLAITGTALSSYISFPSAHRNDWRGQVYSAVRSVLYL